jgi:glycosyltransferase involved in cell wall biosynthesis
MGTNKKITIIHDFLFQFGGAEKIIEDWLEIYPTAEVLVSFIIPEKFLSSKNISKAIQEGRVKTTLIQKLFDLKSSSGSRYFENFQKHLFWLYPLMMRLQKVQNQDLVLIQSTDCAKQVKLYNNSLSYHYCSSPTRYLHNLITETDHKSLPWYLRVFIPLFTFFLKKFDIQGAKNLQLNNTVWLANSEFIQATIWDVYQIKSEVLYPPVNINKFLSNPRTVNTQNSYYLYHGRISFHKRIDLAILACLKLNKKLKISGVSASLSLTASLKNLVKQAENQDPSKVGLIEFLGRTTDKEYLDLLSFSQGFIFPGKEDFGISPVEVLASGVPVIAYEAGGALEYIKNKVNGIFFKEQTVESLVQAISEFEKIDFDENTIKGTCLKFDEKEFKNYFKNLLN